MTVVFGLVAALTMPLLFLLAALIFAVTAPFDPDRRVLHAFVCGACHGYLPAQPPLAGPGGGPGADSPLARRCWW